MDGRLENGFLLLILAVFFLSWGLLRLDARKRYKTAALLQGRVTGWSCFRGWKGSMARKYYEISVMTDKGACLIRTNSGKARKYKKKTDITVMIPEISNPWALLAQLSQNRANPAYHCPQETGALPAECRPTIGQVLCLTALGALFLVLSILVFTGILS